MIGKIQPKAQDKQGISSLSGEGLGLDETQMPTLKWVGKGQMSCRETEGEPGEAPSMHLTWVPLRT